MLSICKLKSWRLFNTAQLYFLYCVSTKRPALEGTKHIDNGEKEDGPLGPVLENTSCELGFKQDARNSTSGSSVNFLSAMDNGHEFGI